MPADLLANIERPPSDRPTPSRDDVTANYPGYWPGPATPPRDTLRWKARALAAEAEVEELRRALAAWRYRP
jgi:hypothetical protein